MFLRLNSLEGGKLRMFFNKLKFILVFAVLLVAGLAFVAIPLQPLAVTPVLSVPDEVAECNCTHDADTLGIQSIRYQSRTRFF